ncbi:MAG: restriction endonuclease [Ignavibacteriaceae bacterium]|nr:restriction endonuclease [Ignavibacteriaceae bacterium]
MNKLTASNLVKAIKNLPKDVTYNYVGSKNPGKIKIIDVKMPEGPILIKRFNPNKKETLSKAKEVSISSQMLWRLANAFTENKPINVDRVLGASYNTRSVLESLLAHTPEFYFCYPGRIESFNTNTEIKHGHKHLLWLPNKPHKRGTIEEAETEMVISEIPQFDAYYDALSIPPVQGENQIDIENNRRHAQIQIALYMIGKQLGFKTWIANNDRGILYNNKRLIEYDGVITKLSDENLMKSQEEAVRAAMNIDCIWFKNGKLMPAVIEIEHSTGVMSGLNRMKTFQDKFPPFPTRYVIAAPDHDRKKVVREASREHYRTLNTKFFPYSAIEELYALCQKRKLRGITEEFLDCYMEPIVN